MPESDVLLTMAEVAVAFAGFASLVGILGRQASSDDPRVLSLRMRVMLLSSLLVVLLSLLPIILDRSGAASATVWATSSWVVLALTTALLAWLWAAFLRLGRVVRATKLQRFLILPTLAVSFTALVVLVVANALGPTSGVYLTILAVLLFLSGLAFCLIVFSFLPKVNSTGSGSAVEGID